MTITLGDVNEKAAFAHKFKKVQERLREPPIVFVDPKWSRAMKTWSTEKRNHYARLIKQKKSIDEAFHLTEFHMKEDFSSER